MVMEDKPADLRSHPGVRGYTLLCVFALLVLIWVLVLVTNGLELWSLLMVLTAIAALVAHWRMGPALLLGCLTILLVAQARFRWRFFGLPAPSSGLPDLVLCAAVLAYVAGHYRLQSIVHHVFPLDPRQRKGRTGLGESGMKTREHSAPSSARSPGLVTSWEIGQLVLTLPLWPLAAYLLWIRLALEMPELNVPLPVWRLLLVLWLIGLALVATGTVFAYLRRAQATPQENLLFLQDQVWRQTRGEQSRLNRWLVWARRRGQRGREKQ
jgi:hypothetical protein